MNTPNQDQNISAAASMNRRDFAKVVASGVLTAGLAGSATVASAATAATARRPRVNTLHHVGGDYHCVQGEHWSGKQNIEFHLRHGVKSFHANMGFGGGGGGGAKGGAKKGGAEKGGGGAAVPEVWNLDEMKRWKDACDKGGLNWDGIRMDSRYIYLRPGDERDRKLDMIIGNIQKAAQVGVKMLTHHWTMIPIRRNGNTPGRGGAFYNSFKLETNWKDLPVESNGVVSSEDYWERISYFLKRIIPVAAQYNVKMAVHPYDPPGLPKGYQGVDNWDCAPATVMESLKRYEAVVDSPFNGFQLCLGTCGEGMKNMKTEILPVVQYLADKGKIHNVHMRNVRGGLNDFQEVYHDEGDMNFIEIIRILRDSGYAGCILPDHAPTHPDDPGKLQAFAFAFGYIKALIDAANLEVKT
jgi:mannonate dehydratase